MASIGKLLNPLPEPASSDSEFEPLSRNRQSSRKASLDAQARKKQKLCKDAAVFNRGAIRGECRYPPHEYQDDFLAAQHVHFEVYPVGEIADYPRHIPYNSEKKSLSKKTGRESLEGELRFSSRVIEADCEVFQYCFKVPGDETTYSVLWDYNIGLVRTTPLFKCTGHSKTTPAKMLNRNPGLREVCHSITGGALVAQGYWMPYEAAKAIAATFCWEIRYALTPVFGTDFPDLCIPMDSEKYGEMIIDPAITQRCAEQAREYHALEEKASSRASTATPGPLTPVTPTFSRSDLSKANSTRQSDSNCSSEISNDEDYCVHSPISSYSNMWTPANTPRSTPRLPFLQDLMPRRKKTKRSANSIPRSDAVSPAVSPKTVNHVLEDAYDGDGDGSSDDGGTCVADLNEHSTREGSPRTPAELMAASWLLHFKMHGSSPQARKRRASA